MALSLLPAAAAETELPEILIPNGDFETDSTNLVEAAESLLYELCRIEAEATPEEAEAFLKKYAEPGKDILDALDKLVEIPIDIRVEYKL